MNAIDDGDFPMPVKVKVEEFDSANECDGIDTEVLYTDHEVKCDLVLGPEQIQPQDVAFAIQQLSINPNAVKHELASAEHPTVSHSIDKSGLGEVPLKPCYVRLERIQVTMLHTCLNCCKTFHDKSSLTTHNCVKHREKKIICNMCKKQYISGHKMTNHTCNICRKKLNVGSLLTKHTISKTKIPKRRCYEAVDAGKRKLKPNPCIGGNCNNYCQYIKEEKRKEIFDHYWSLSRPKQCHWIHSMTKIDTIRKSNCKLHNFTFQYFINDNEDRRRVCRRFYLNTLDLRQSFVYNTLANSFDDKQREIINKTLEKSLLANQSTASVIQNVRDFLEHLPAVSSYHCKDSTKLYLPAEFESLKKLYQIYKEEKTKENVGTVGEITFNEIIKKDFNYEIHVHKKNKCIKCRAFVGKYTEENKQLKLDHLKEVEAGYERLKYHQEIREKHSGVLCTSFDLQRVLNTPYGKSPLLYYSRKLSIYNECFYENETTEGLCFIWSETNGRRGANEIATILQRYIKIVDLRKTVKNLLLYADSCPRKNHNVTVLAAIHNSLLRCKNIQSVQINYLLPGHAVMPVTVMQSIIEGSIKNCIVWAPSQWYNICRLARQEPQPYQVNFLHYTDFKGYKEFSDNYFEGNLTDKISNIRIAKFKKSSIHRMTVKYSMQKDASEERISIKGFSGKKIDQQLYKAHLPISETKYSDLKKLCDDGVVPKKFRDAYYNLPFSRTERDTLNETDIEDEIED